MFRARFWPRPLSVYEAARLVDATATPILVCTGPPKEPKHGLAFVGVRQAREALPTIDYMIVGIEDDQLPYAHGNFDMVLRTVPTAEDTTGTRFDVTLEMHAR